MGTRLAKELEEFSGDLSLEGLHFWKTAFSAMTHTATLSSQALGAVVPEASKKEPESDPSSARHKKVVLLPCKSPPSRERVQLWLEAKKQYENLQKWRKDVRLLKKGGDEVDVEERNLDRTEQTFCCSEVKVELCGKTSSRTRRRTKRNLSLGLSPLVKTGSQCKSTDLSPVLDEAAVDLEQKEEELGDDNKTTSPESPELPTWQQTCQPTPSGTDQICDNSPGPLSPRLSDSLERLAGNRSPSPRCASNREQQRTSPHLLHSTPVISRRQRTKEDLEPVCSTPICEGNSSI